MLVALARRIEEGQIARIWCDAVAAVQSLRKACRGFCAGPFPSGDDAFAEDDGELRFCLGPFTWQALPVLRQMIEHEI